MKKIALVIALAGLANFILYCVIAASIGGDAVNGHQADGHYYLASHAKLTEVSQSVFTYSRYHTYSVWVTHALAICALLLLATSQKKRET
jgi:hypothetical protein